MRERIREHIRQHPVELAVLVLYSVCILLLLPYRGIQWGDGLEFSAVAAHLGVAHPSGYPTFTMAGWISRFLPMEEPYDRYLVACRVFVILFLTTTHLISREFLRLANFPEQSCRIVALFTTLGLGCSSFVLKHANFVEVYGLHTAFLSAFAFHLLYRRRYSPGLDGKVLVALGLLLGYAMANHLTAASLLPLYGIGVYLWWRESRRTAVAVVLLPCPIVISAMLFSTMLVRVPPMDSGYGIFWGDTHNLTLLLEHIRGGEYRQFQFMMLNPATPFDAASYLEFVVARCGLMMGALGSIFAGAGPTAGIAGVLVLCVFLWGSIRSLCGDQALFCSALLGGILLQVAFVYTYNIPDVRDYFLSIFVLGVPFFVWGLADLVQRLLTRLAFDATKGLKVLHTVAALLFLGGLSQTFPKPEEVDTSALPTLWSERLLAALPPDASILTAGDIDTYTLWYERFAKENRLDVFLYGGNFVRFPWFRMTGNPEDKRRWAVRYAPGPPPHTLQEYIETLRNNAIEPLLTNGRLFTTIAQPAELAELARHYRIEPVASLLSDKEFMAVIESDEPALPPTILYEIERKAAP